MLMKKGKEFHKKKKRLQGELFAVVLVFNTSNWKNMSYGNYASIFMH